MVTSSCDWIDQNNPIQVDWIIGYLSKRHAGFYQNFKNNKNVFKNLDSLTLINAIEANMYDPLFRECYEKSKNAWRQKKVRQQPDKKSATFVLPVSTLNTLEKLSRKHKNTKVKELCTIISDAWHDHSRATKLSKKISSTYQRKLKNQREDYVKREQVYQRAIEILLTTLSEQIDRSCALEVKVGKDDNSPLEAGDIESYKALVESYSTDIIQQLKVLSLVRFNGVTLNDRLEYLSQERKDMLKDSNSLSEL